VAGYRGGEGGAPGGKGQNLLPTVKKNFNARRTLHAAIDTVRAINKLREGQLAGLMDGARSQEPARGGAAGTASALRQQNQSQQPQQQQNAGGETPAGTRKDDSGVSMASSGMERDSGYGTQAEMDASGDVAMGEAPPIQGVPAVLRPGSEANRVVETSKGLWSGVGSRG
jgi:hypothetical protein